MPFIYVGGKDKLILPPQHLLGQLHPDLMGLFRCGLPRLKSLYQVAAQVRSLINGMAAGPGKFYVSTFR